MKPVSGIILSLSGVLLLSSCGADAFAYEFLKTKSQAHNLRWWSGRPAYTWSLSTVEPEEGSWEDLQGLIETAFDAWTDTPCGLLPEFSAGEASTATGLTIPKKVYDTPDNVIVFVRSRVEWQNSGFASSWLAFTHVASDESTGQIVDADILINDGMYTYHYGEGAPPPGQIDFRAMIVHEVGHVFGMDHSAVSGATMNSNYASDKPVNARALDQDDIDGACELYTDVPQWGDLTPKPPGETTDGCGSGAAPGFWEGLVGLFALGFRRRGTRA